jgi:hypothetical protein
VRIDRLSHEGFAMSYRHLRTRRTSLEAGQTDGYEMESRSWARLSPHMPNHRIHDKIELRLASRTIQFPDITQLLKWYRRTAATHESELIRKSLWLSKSGGGKVDFEDAETVAECFVKILDELDAVPASGLRVCAVCASTEGPLFDSYSFPYEVYLTLSRKVSDAARIFHLLTTRLLTVCWADTQFEQDVIERLIAQPTPQKQKWQPDLPSARRRINTPSAETSSTNAQHALSRPTDLRTIALSDFVYLEWQWLQTTSQYDQDFDIYVWEPFKERPRLDYVRLALLPETNPNERKMLLVASSTRLLEALAGYEVSLAEDAKAQFLAFLTHLYSTMRDDITHFLTTTTAKVDELDLRSRSNPSGWKAQLLNHIQECNFTVAKHIDESLGILAALLTHYEGSESQELVDAKQDLRYLARECRRKAQAINPVKKHVKEQMELVNNYRNAVIAVLVALYVPISFVSSFLGMNIVDRSSANYSRNYTSTAPSGGSTGNNSLAGNYTVSTTNLGNRNWSLTSFWASAFPLAFGTIVIPLIAGPAFRWLVQFARKQRVWWRVVVAFVGLAYVPWIPFPWATPGSF